MDGGRTARVVIISPSKHRQVNMLVHQLTDGVLERARHQLILQRNRQHDQLIFVEWFVFCHRGYLSLVKPIA